MTDPVFAISHIVDPYQNATKDPATGRTAVGIPVGVIPHDQQFINLKPFFDAWRTKPERRVGTVHLSPESFIDYVQRYRNQETTVLFVTPIWWGKYIITAIFNYHPAGSEEDMTGSGDFRAVTATRDYKSLAATLNMTAWVGKYADV